MELHTIATYAILITGALLLMVVAYSLLRAFVRGAVLLARALFDVLKIAFKTLYFFLLLVLVAVGIQLVLGSIQSFPGQTLYRAAWAVAGVLCVATGVLGLALRLREHRKRYRAEQSFPESSQQEPAFPYRAFDPGKGGETEEDDWKRKEEEELQRQFQLMKAKEVERELAYQKWVAEQEDKDQWRQEQADSAEQNRQKWERYRRDEA